MTRPVDDWLAESGARVFRKFDGEKFRAWRRRRRLSQRALADLIRDALSPDRRKTSPQLVSRWELGRGVPSCEQFVASVLILEVEIKDLTIEKERRF